MAVKTINKGLLHAVRDQTWFNNNASLLLYIGQQVYLNQTGTYKMGDGVTALSSLAFLGGGGSGSYTFQQGITNASGTVTNDLITGKTGGQLIIGGTAVGDGLIYQSTTGIGTASGLAHSFVGGNNGTVTGLKIYNDGTVLAGPGSAVKNSGSIGNGLRISQGTAIIDIGQGITAGTSGIWLNGNLSPSQAALLQTSTTLSIQAPTSMNLALGIAGSNQLNITSSVATFTNNIAATNFLWDNTNTLLYIGGNSGAFPQTKLQIYDNFNGFSQLSYQNTNSGTSASSDLVTNADTATNTSNYGNFGTNSSTYSVSSYTITGPVDTYAVANGGNLVMGTETAKDIVFFTGGTLAANEVGRFVNSSKTLALLTNLTVTASISGGLLPTIKNTNSAGYSNFIVYDDLGTTFSSLITLNSTSAVGTLYDAGTAWLACQATATGIINQKVGGNIVFAAGGFGSTSEMFRIQPPGSSGAIPNFTFRKRNTTNQTLSTSIPGWQVLGASRQWATGTIADQAENSWTASTYTAVAGSTITTAVGNDFYSPIASTNIVITNNYAIRSNGDLNLLGNLQTDTTTGMKIGGSTTQKIAFYGVTPIVQPVAATDLGVVLSSLGLRVAGTAYTITTSGAASLTGGLTLNASNIITDATTGTKIGTGTTQKFGFWNVTPVVQPVATTDLGTVLSSVGLRAAGTAYPITTSGAVSMTGGVTLNHIIGSSTAPGIAAGTGAGTTPTVTLSGTDLSGFVSVTTGTLPTASAVVVTVTFNVAYGAAPKCVQITPANATTAALTGTSMVFVDQAGLGTTTFAITAGTVGLAAATAYKWYYTVIQ